VGVGLEPTSLQAGASFQDWFLSQFGAPHPKEEQRKAKESGEKRSGCPEFRTKIVSN